jgi:hypothetical protein
MNRGIKRRAALPQIAINLGTQISKADLLEAAWHLAGQVSDGYGNDTAHLVRLVEELRVIRENNGRPVLRIKHYAIEDCPCSVCTSNS